MLINENFLNRIMSIPFESLHYAFAKVLDGCYLHKQVNTVQDCRNMLAGFVNQIGNALGIFTCTRLTPRSMLG